MNSIDTSIPNDWMPHGFCPRDLVPSLRLRKHDGSVILELNWVHLYIALISMLLAVACFLFGWGTETNDVQLKLIVFGTGCVFTILAFGALLTNYRFAKYGQSFEIDTDNDEMILIRHNSVERIALQDLKGLQILSRSGDSQLNLLYETDGHLERRWLHTDLTSHIELLARAFERDCRIHVVSRIDTRPRKAG